MKSTTFFIDPSTGSYNSNNNRVDFVIDTLPAYAIEYSILVINGVNYHDGFSIVSNTVHWEGLFRIEPGGVGGTHDTVILNIYYHGIRDYGLLFPKINDTDSRSADRLGRYYEEAERCFDGHAWLSFAVMCGAIFEGILYAKYRTRENFSHLIEKAEREGDIDSNTAAIMHRARKFRNQVHAPRDTEAYIERKDAMDMRTTLDKLLKGFHY